MPFKERIWQFGRTAMVGGVATAANLGSLALLVQGVGLTPRQANVPSLLCGLGFQFFGNRHFAFRAGDGHLGRQATIFLACEAVSFGLNLAVFDLLVTRTPLHYSVARLAGTGIVFIAFSYPLWHLVFKTPRKETRP